MDFSIGEPIGVFGLEVPENLPMIVSASTDVMLVSKANERTREFLMVFPLETLKVCVPSMLLF